MTKSCTRIAEQYKDKISQIIDAQINENREAIFFIYEDGSTTDLFKGEPTQISLSREEEARVLTNGNLVGSVHSHPSKPDPSTIDIMTGIMTRQERMCVASPIHEEDVESDFILTCVDLSHLNIVERRRLIKAMRRSSIGITEAGKEIRKQGALQRFGVNSCRTHKVKVDGLEIPIIQRPSKLDIKVGKVEEIVEIDGEGDYV